MQSRRTLLLSLSGALLATRSVTSGEPPTRAALSAFLTEKVDHNKISPGIVVGVLDKRGQRIRSHGNSGAPGVPLDGDKVFDVGSLTKLLTALTLADMVVRGEVAMSDPLQKFLPGDVRAPDYHGRPITLLDLVTYSPGVPGWPADMPELSTERPFPQYSVAQLYKALSNVTLDAEPGARYVYSNFGYGLLGLALAQRARTDFESLVVSRVCAPLRMDSTCVTLTSALRRRAASGHDQKLARVSNWNLPPAFAAAGAFRSTANDLMKFLSAAMGDSQTPLAPAFAEMLRIQRASDQSDTKVGAGWFVTSAHDNQLIWKDGGVLGYVSFLGYSPVHGNGVVVLVNGMIDIAPLGKRLLDREFSAPG